MKRLCTAEQMRALDRAAAEAGTPVAALMESAGAALAEVAGSLAAPQARVLVVCGHGHNGGDGLVAARRLAQAGRRIRVELVAPAALKGEPAEQLAALERTGVAVSPADEVVALGPGDLVIDALLGTGLTRPPAGPYAAAIARIARFRAQGARVLAADLPSGLHSDTGAPLEPCVRADATVSFGLLKVGQALEPGASLCGQLHLAPLGFPPAAVQSISGPASWLLEEGDVRARLPVRPVDAHKGTFGHVLVVAGSAGKSGAAALAGLGALRGGAGLVSVAARAEALSAALAHSPVLMGEPLLGEGPLGLGELEPLVAFAQGKAALVIGPGIPRGEATGELILRLLSRLDVPCVLDADGLNALAGRLHQLRGARGPVVLTPHPGEASRLLGVSTAKVQADRCASARNLAAQSGAVAVLKGARTVVALPDGTTFLNPTGNAGMATGGSGDVLAGLAAALLAQGLPAADAAQVAVYAHGLSGDLAASRTGKLGLLATDLLEALGEVWARWAV